MLLVDIGNSNFKWAITKEKQLIKRESFPLEIEYLTKKLDKYWRLFQKPSRILVSNVAGSEVAKQLRQWAESHWRIETEFIQPQSKAFGVENAYPEPHKLGADRWVGIVALRHHFRLPACMIDCGTAITLDFLDDKGIHQGGLIAPGLSLMEDALLKGTQGVQLSGGSNEGFLARCTEDAICRGTLFAAAGFVDTAIKRLKDESAASPTIVFTGGRAQAIAALLSIPTVIYEPDLIFMGLSTIAGQSN